MSHSGLCVCGCLLAGGGGGGGASGDSASGDSDAEESPEEEFSVRDEAACARGLAALNALRKSRQHYDVLLLAAGAEVPAHRALLAAHSPYLLHALSPAPPAPPASPSPASPDDALAPAPAAAEALRVEGVEPEALRALVEYAYTGRLAARDAAGARALYLAAWRLRVEPPRALLAERLARRLTPLDALPLRALPDLPPHHLHALDSYIAHNFDEVCASGALAALPLVRIEMLRASSAEGGSEAPLAVADAALVWLRDHRAAATVEELCARTHLLFVDEAGALRDCGELPAARGDAPELQEYRRARKDSAALHQPPPRPPRALAGLALGARAARADWCVLAARGAAAAGGGAGGSRVTRALLVVRGALAAARVSWREVGAAGGEGGAGVAVGGPLGGAGARDAAAEGERRAPLSAGRCALGAAALGGRLVVCGGYDRARVLRAADAYDPAANAWAPLGALRTARARFPAAQLGRRLYVLGGSDGQNELDSVDVYEEEEGGGGSGRWVAAARLPLAVVHLGAAADAARGALYAAGGWAGGRSLRAVHRYDPAADAWHEAPPLTIARSQCACVCWEDAVWALGGCDAWHCLASTERLALGAPAGGGGGWQAGPALPTARRSVGGCEWAGRLVSAGGSDGAASLRRVDWLAPGAAEWRPGPALRRARAALGLAVLRGVLYAVGGFDGKEFLSCMECLYSPDGEWTTLCAPPAPPAPTAPPAPRAEADQPATDESPERKENGEITAE